jgi:hypothetical protein
MQTYALGDFPSVQSIHPLTQMQNVLYAKVTGRYRTGDVCPIINESNVFFVDTLNKRLEAAAINCGKEANPEPVYANPTIGLSLANNVVSSCALLAMQPESLLDITRAHTNPHRLFH